MKTSERLRAIEAQAHDDWGEDWGPVRARIVATFPLLVDVAADAERLAAYKRPFNGEAFTNLQASVAALTDSLDEQDA